VYNDGVAARAHSRSTGPARPVLYQLGRVGDHFVVGDGPIDLGAQPRPLVLGRREERSSSGDRASSKAVVEAGRVGVDDPWMSSRHARIVEGTRAPTASSGLSPRLFIEDMGSKNGVVVNGAAAPRTPLIHGDILEMGRTFFVYVEDRSVEPLLFAPVELGAMATWHPRLGAQLSMLQQHLTTSEHAVVFGPDGSGKGFLARTLHQLGRRDGRFLHLDCRAKRPRTASVDLFGGDGGGQGKLRDAGAGTLLIENVDALPADLQERLGLALRERSYIPSGKNRPVALDLRVVATLSVGATLRPALRDAFALRVDMPALSDRLCDLGLLLDDALARAKGASAIARDACRVLFRHRFPQNLRGFGRVVEAAASLAIDDDGGGRVGTIELRHLPFCVAGIDAMRGLLQRASELASPIAPMDTPERTGVVPVLSATGPDGAALGGDDVDGGVDGVDSIDEHGFSSSIPTDAAAVVRPSASAPRQGTKSAFEAAADDFDDEVSTEGGHKRSARDHSEIWADNVDADAIVAALKRARGNVSAAARALGRPRALVLRWLRDLNLDPLQFS
jgi:DNA-binding NtrC family response regulator